MRTGAVGREVTRQMPYGALDPLWRLVRVVSAGYTYLLRSFQHISHPSIVSYLHSFSTPSHHCLVLEYVGGGELLDLVDNPAKHARVDEPLVRRIWGELCRAVAWMHSVGLVHRDIKLESTSRTPSSHCPLPVLIVITQHTHLYAYAQTSC